MQAPGVRPSYPGIDLLRALAALLVLVYHVIEIGRWSAFPTTGPLALLRQGWIGVDLFLTISGFVITLSALDGMERDGPAFRRAFASRRLARIVPLYLVTGLVFLTVLQPNLLLLDLHTLTVHIGSHLLFLHNLNHHTHGSINAPNWSVALEMQFYLAMVVLTPWLARVRVLPLLLGALLLAAAWRFATTLVLVPGAASPIAQFIYATQLPGVIDEFALGIALALVLRRGRGAWVAWLAVDWRHCLGWLAVSVALLTLAAWLFTQHSYWQHAAMITLWRPLLAAGFTALLGAVITCPAAGAASLAPVRYLGTISYGIYLWHFLVLTAFVGRAPWLQGSALLWYVLSGTLAMAAVSWHLLEKPNLGRAKQRRAIQPA